MTLPKQDCVIVGGNKSGHTYVQWLVAVLSKWFFFLRTISIVANIICRIPSIDSHPNVKHDWFNIDFSHLMCSYLYVKNSPYDNPVFSRHDIIELWPTMWLDFTDGEGPEIGQFTFWDSGDGR